ncbi:FkbM family methyltransferase [Streptomyces boninensis]|uniref:FkbM family methyltransferase n=1 Tax=Streptomyces boninensis TaxID=2039455 RepID=UPI003B225B3A
MSGRQRFLSRVICGGRRLLQGTPLAGSGVTSAVSAALYRRAFPPGRAEAMVVPFRGLGFNVAEGDRCIAPAIAAGEYEDVALTILETLAGSARVIVDVGANIGLHSCLAARRQPPGGRVVAFEPVPVNLRALERNVRLNGCTDAVRIEPLAAGARAGTVTMRLSAANGGAHSIAPDGAATGGQQVEVRQVRLDDRLAELGVGPPDILKIDVEGWEVSALRGAGDLLTRSRCAVLAEYVPSQVRACGEDPERLLDHLYADGRRVYALDEFCGRLRRVAREELSAWPGDNPHCANLLSLSRPDHLARLPEDAERPFGCTLENRHAHA